MNKNSEDSALFIVDDVIMIVLALVSVFLFVLDIAGQTTLRQAQLIDRVDVAIAIIFLLEFVIKLYFADNKSDFFKRNWWYLLASIPVSTPATQALRALRLLRLVRLMRLITGTHAILGYIHRFFKQTHILYVLILFVSVVGICATMFDFFEFGINQNVHGFFDSIWWAMTTVSTVGYGDIFPVTIGGRITAMVTMILGVGMTGTFTALIASFLVREHWKQ